LAAIGFYGSDRPGKGGEVVRKVLKRKEEQK